MEAWRNRGRKPVVTGEAVPSIMPRDKQVGFTVGNFTAYFSLDEAAKIVNGWKSLAAGLPDNEAKDFCLRF